MVDDRAGKACIFEGPNQQETIMLRRNAMFSLGAAILATTTQTISVDAAQKGVAFVLPEGAVRGQVLNIFGQTITEKVVSEDSDGLYYVVRQTSAPGSGVPPHVHTIEDEIVFINAGEYEVFLEGKVTKAGAGSLLNFPRGIYHGYRAIGEGGDMTWVVNPGASFQAFFRELASFPPGPPDLKRLDALHAKHGITMPVPSKNWW
jgi:quercetin dioxygenase-like cupin family protein